MPDYCDVLNMSSLENLLPFRCVIEMRSSQPLFYFTAFTLFFIEAGNYAGSFLPFALEVLLPHCPFERLSQFQRPSFEFVLCQAFGYDISKETARSISKGRFITNKLNRAQFLLV